MRSYDPVSCNNEKETSMSDTLVLQRAFKASHADRISFRIQRPFVVSDQPLEEACTK
jgi:hypothetical protein